LNNATPDDWLDRFPALATAPEAERRRLLAVAQALRVPAGTTVFRPGDACQNYLMVAQGSVRVQKVSESGREIVLYRVEPGQTCVLTTSCLLAGERYPAEGVTETEVVARVLPLAPFHELLAASDVFRHFVFSSFGCRMAELMALVEEVAFGRMDSRLAQRLLALGGSSGRIEIRCVRSQPRCIATYAAYVESFPPEKRAATRTVLGRPYGRKRFGRVG